MGQPTDPANVCPKCGSTRIRTEYVEMEGDRAGILDLKIPARRECLDCAERPTEQPFNRGGFIAGGPTPLRIGTGPFDLQPNERLIDRHGRVRGWVLRNRIVVVPRWLSRLLPRWSGWN